MLEDSLIEELKKLKDRLKVYDGSISASIVAKELNGILKNYENAKNRKLDIPF
jgi:hypothetical protein